MCVGKRVRERECGNIVEHNLRLSFLSFLSAVYELEKDDHVAYGTWEISTGMDQMCVLCICKFIVRNLSGICVHV